MITTKPLMRLSAAEFKYWQIIAGKYPGELVNHDNLIASQMCRDLRTLQELSADVEDAAGETLEAALGVIRGFCIRINEGAKILNLIEEEIEPEAMTIQRTIVETLIARPK